MELLTNNVVSFEQPGTDVHHSSKKLDPFVEIIVSVRQLLVKNLNSNMIKGTLMFCNEFCEYGLMQ